MSKENNQDVVQLYLSKMDSAKFMDREEEQRVCKIVQETTDKIFETCLPYPAFRNQLYKLKASIERNKSKISRVLKDITEESSDEDVHLVEKRFQDLFSAIDEKRPIRDIISKLKFTNSTIVSLVNPVKEAHREYASIEDSIKQSYKFLEVDSREQYDLLIYECSKSKDILSNVARSLYTTPETLAKHIRSINDNQKRLEEMDANDDFKGIKSLYSKISELESEVETYRNKLIEANLPLVVNRARKFIKYQMDFEDLIQEGNIGLIKAIDKFEYDKGFRLTTYATWWIDQAIRRAISNKSSLVRIPIHIQDRLQRINKSYFKLSQRYYREPSLSEIADDTGIDLDEVTAIMTSAIFEIGVDTQVSDGVTVSDLLASNIESPLDHTSKNILQEKVRAALASLKNPKYEKVLRLRFGIGEVNDHTLEEIGQHLGLTKERIRQIEKKALIQVSKKPGIKDSL